MKQTEVFVPVGERTIPRTHTSTGARPLAPTRTASSMFLRELRRKWLSLLFMLLMPTFYFFVM